MSQIPETINRYALGNRVSLASPNHDHDICDSITMIRSGSKRSLMFVFHDYAGTLSPTLDWRIMPNVDHLTISHAATNKVELFLEGDTNIIVGLKALFRSKVRDENGGQSPLISAGMQKAILKECEGLILQAGNGAALDEPHHDAADHRVFD